MAKPRMVCGSCCNFVDSPSGRGACAVDAFLSPDMVPVHSASDIAAEGHKGATLYSSSSASTCPLYDKKVVPVIVLVPQEHFVALADNPIEVVPSLKPTMQDVIMGAIYSATRLVDHDDPSLEHLRTNNDPADIIPF